MTKYQNNLKALDNLRKTNKQIDDIEKTLKGKYLCNKQELLCLQRMLNDSMNKYHNIMKNLDGFLS